MIQKLVLGATSALFLATGLLFVFTTSVKAQPSDALEAKEFFCHTRYSKAIDDEDSARKEACQKGYDTGSCDGTDGEAKDACIAGVNADKPIPEEPQDVEQEDIPMPDPPKLETNALGGVNRCGTVDTAYVMCPATSGDGISGSPVWGMLTVVLNIAIALIGIAAIGGMVYAGTIYASSRDDEARVRQARTLLMNIGIGLVIFAALYLLLQFIIPGGIF